MARAEPGGWLRAARPHRPASRGPPGRTSADVPALLALAEADTVAGAGAGGGAEREAWAQAAWGWGAVTERTPHGALTPSPTILLPPEPPRILYLVWSLIFLPPERVRKICTPGLW